jgi:hypothetical protein
LRGTGLGTLSAFLCMLVAAFPGHASAYLLKTTKTGHRVRWSSPVITLRVDEKLEKLYGRGVVDSAIGIAVEAWRGLPNVPDILISSEPAPGYQTEQRTNGIYLMSPWPFAREQLAVTVSTYDLDGRMIGADILVNGDSDYALLNDGGDQPSMGHHDIAAVLTHEMGHVLGLDESPDDQAATMWPYIRGGDVHQRTLSEDDEQGVIEAYHDVTFETVNHGCTQASVLGARPDSASCLQLSALLFAAAWIMRRNSRNERLSSLPPPPARVASVVHAAVQRSAATSAAIGGSYVLAARAKSIRPLASDSIRARMS